MVPEGTQDVAVNALIAVLAGEGEDVKAAAAGAAKAPAQAAKRRDAKPAPSFETPALRRAPQDEAEKRAAAGTKACSSS